MSQLGLFGESAVTSPGDDEATRALAKRLPPQLRFGTSSWSFAGWRGVVWPDASWTDARAAREGLPLYAKHPLLRTVGIDRSFYGPLTLDESTRYASQMPGDFRPIAKVWQEQAFVTGRSVDTLVKRLRKKIEIDPADPQLIITVWGDGYKFADVSSKSGEGRAHSPEPRA